MRDENNCSECSIPLPFGKRKCSHCLRQKELEQKRKEKISHKLNVSDNSKIAFWGNKEKF